MARLSYATRVLLDLVRAPFDTGCPYCGTMSTIPEGHKHILLRLRRCRECHLRYRLPKDRPSRARAYYESRYDQRSVTDLPDSAELTELIASNFVGSRFDKSDKVERMAQLAGRCRAEWRVLDFGASFGYMLHQMLAAGFTNVTGYEFARGRAEFARMQLNVDVESDLSMIRGAFDLVYSSHVLEHAADPRAMLDDLARLTMPGGLLLLWTPNPDYPAHPHWKMVVGEVHPCAIGYGFLRYVLPQHGFALVEADSVDAEEVCVVARRRCFARRAAPPSRRSC
jgi:2-polyprenyl-3-methyl-5-hydroxy-6-metoxy-1,4-benzoquinol methylase